MNMSLSVALEPKQIMTISHTPGYKRYRRGALNAFRKVTLRGMCFFSCNVQRLWACNRLGSEKEVKLWRTTFFVESKYFRDTCGAIFSQRPGEELVGHVQRWIIVESLYIALTPRILLNVDTGEREELEKPIEFASDPENKDLL